MRFLIALALLVPPAAGAQLGAPMSSLPGVQSGAGAVPGAGTAAAGSGIPIPRERLDRVLRASGVGAPAGSNVGEEIERSFHGAQPERRRAFADFPGAIAAPGVAAPGIGVAVPIATPGVPPVPALGTMRAAPAGGSPSTTGVGNLYTGTGRPRAGDAP